MTLGVTQLIFPVNIRVLPSANIAHLSMVQVAANRGLNIQKHRNVGVENIPGR